jgi:16S rRNA (guanine1207-N2)-methyltransferase
MKDPWYKTSFQYSALGANLKLAVPHDVFSTQRIDEGTLLLLEHLPKNEPPTILDMGCGYGALGLPIAAHYPKTKIDMVDRDLLAAKWSHENALANQLSNVNAFGSLGFRDIHQTYDWILCNVPARIGNPFIENLIEQGRALLNEGGELRVVVIRDLGPVLLEMKEKNHWPLIEVAKGPRHTIFSIAAQKGVVAPIEPDTLYLRDQVNVADLTLDRPFDIGGDDQKRLKAGLPVLIDTLPRQDPEKKLQKILCFRCGYGSLPLVSLKRWPHARVIAVDRDLLGTTFTRLNAKKLGVEDRLEVRENAHFPDAISAGEKFNLILGELSPSADQWVAMSEMLAIEQALAPGADALILCLDKIEKDWVKTFAQNTELAIHKVLTREGYTVVRFSKP